MWCWYLCVISYRAQIKYSLSTWQCFKPQYVSLWTTHVFLSIFLPKTRDRWVGFSLSQNLLLHLKAVWMQDKPLTSIRALFSDEHLKERVLCFIEGSLLPNIRGGCKPWHEAQRTTKASPFITKHLIWALPKFIAL